MSDKLAMLFHALEGVMSKPFIDEPQTSMFRSTQ
jgi:hypothetical protein